MSMVKKIYFGARSAILTALARHRTGEVVPGQVQSVCVIRIDRIGDFIVSLPAIKALKELFPLSRVCVVLDRRNIPLASAFPYIDEVIEYDGFFATGAKLREKKFDVVFDFMLDHRLRSAFLARMSGAFTCGFDVEGRGVLFSRPVSPVKERKRMGQHLLDLVNSAGARLGRPAAAYAEPRLFLSKEQKEFGSRYLRRAGIAPGSVVIGAHPGGYYPSQRWPAERFAGVINEIGRNREISVLLFGSKTERRLLEYILSLCKVKVVLCEGLDTGRLAALIGEVAVLIANNSGPLHIAAALGIPTVSTMGPTDPWLWQPAGNRAIVMRKELGCSPCGKPRCTRHSCMTEISVEEVTRAVEKQLGNVNNHQLPNFNNQTSTNDQIP